MTGDQSFRVEDFLEAITSQLDRTQDSLRLKAVNRPLTYAIRDFSLDMKVFVELDDEGQVRFRSSGSDDTGASTVTIGFTTITRPMIEENTVSLSEVQGPSLEDIGLAPHERRSLEKIGVRNAGQLKRLNSSSGEDAVSKFANLPVNRLRAALQRSRPTVDRVDAESRGTSPTEHPISPADRRSVRVPAGTRRLRLGGNNLGDLQRSGTASLDGRPVPIVSSAGDHLVVDLGGLEPAGLLTVDAEGETLSFQLSHDAIDEPPQRSEDVPPIEGPPEQPSRSTENPWDPA